MQLEKQCNDATALESETNSIKYFRVGTNDESYNKQANMFVEDLISPVIFYLANNNAWVVFVRLQYRFRTRF